MNAAYRCKLCREDFENAPKRVGWQYREIDGGKCGWNTCSEQAKYEVYPFGVFMRSGHGR